MTRFIKCTQAKFVLWKIVFVVVVASRRILLLLIIAYEELFYAMIGLWLC